MSPVSPDKINQGLPGGMSENATGASVDYREIIRLALALTHDETDIIANMANITALLWDYLPDINWAGFYRLHGNTLVLGPFQGKTACTRIKIGQGVCGTAIEQQKSLCVPNVYKFPGHIACDAQSRSELVIPIINPQNSSSSVGVLDIDSPRTGRFTQADLRGCEDLIAAIRDKITG